MITIHVRNRCADYQFDISQKYNLLTGDSGTGKTTLYNMISAYDENKNNIQCLGYKKLGTDITLLRVLSDMTLEDDEAEKHKLLHSVDGYFIILDENSSILQRKNAPSILKKFNCYFLIICRKIALGFKSISLDCVFELVASGKYHKFIKHYNLPTKMFLCNEIICEDSKSGMQFIKSVLGNAVVSYARGSDEDTLGGKAKFVACLSSYTNCNLCIVFDKAAIGYDMDGILEKIKQQKLHVCFIDWDSFESYVLESPAFNVHVPEPECYYESKEVLATKLLNERIHYSKETLPACLRPDRDKYYHKTDGSGSYYSFDDLIYWKIKEMVIIMNSNTPTPMKF